MCSELYNCSNTVMYVLFSALPSFTLAYSSPPPPSLSSSLSSLPLLLLLPPPSDPSTYGLSRVAQAVCDEPTLRLQNLQLVVNCIKHFYMVSQKQLVITSLPEVSEIAHDPAGGK